MNFLNLNKDKTEAIVFGANEEWLKICAQLQYLMLQITNHARNLAAAVYSDSASQVLTKTRKVDHITPVLKSLHWLPLHQDN